MWKTKKRQGVLSEDMHRPESSGDGFGLIGKRQGAQNRQTEYFISKRECMEESCM